ncbi:MAG: biotin--[acetyl-CoA-carboxylase] ligase [Planctomycetota bacterium]|nr:biotin--[acetyl-CoA-carboxylase] ligase [Planctomycetota bacterium]
MDPRVSLSLRRGHGQSIPPADLAAALGLAPHRLAEAVHDLSEVGFVVEAHPMLGLRLVGAPAGLLAEELACELAVNRVGRHIECVEATASTNDLAWETVAQGRDASDGLAIFAEHQTAGRGRRGSRWLAPPHTAILCSVVLWMPRAGAAPALLTRAAAVAAAEAIEEQSDLTAGIKWPNDVVVEDRKVGGILVEARPAAEGTTAVVIGIGLNGSQGPEAFPPDMRPYVASLAMLGAEVDRTLLARSLLERLDRVCGGADWADENEDVRHEAARRCRTIGRRITLAEGGEVYEGEVVDLDPDYGLILRLADGSQRRFGTMTSHVVSGGRAGAG